VFKKWAYNFPIGEILDFEKEDLTERDCRPRNYANRFKV
jgi:hypothetical protein